MAKIDFNFHQLQESLQKILEKRKLTNQIISSKQATFSKMFVILLLSVCFGNDTTLIPFIYLVGNVCQNYSTPHFCYLIN